CSEGLSAGEPSLCTQGCGALSPSQHFNFIKYTRLESFCQGAGTRREKRRLFYILHYIGRGARHREKEKQPRMPELLNEKTESGALRQNVPGRGDYNQKQTRKTGPGETRKRTEKALEPAALDANHTELHRRGKIPDRNKNCGSCTKSFQRIL
ncbi:hypothetical protein, partial [Fournierella sp.]|uniref:hypothetical protein n=1 Tax=Allofournierella sp. TaxID=1940256 RepID=UPI0025BC0163